MRRIDEPNASHYSARYWEMKRAQERARDAAAGPRPCNKCSAIALPSSLFCSQHAAEYDRLLASGASVQECSDFCQRTYWPNG
jgi:hypothetical protein